MEIQKVKEILITILLGVCVIGFIFFLGIASYNLYKLIPYYWGGGSSYGSNLPSIYGTCNKLDDDTYVISVSINTYNKEMKNVKCQLASKGGMQADKEEETIGAVSPNSSDFCEFTLKGKRAGSIRVRVNYLLKSWFGYKEYSTIVDPYCSSPYIEHKETPTWNQE